MIFERLETRFDPIILGALPLVVPAFPPGSIVRSSTGQRAVVINWHPDASCQPVVQVLPENEPSHHRDSFKPRQFDRRQRGDLGIVEHDEIDVSGDCFRLVSTPENMHKLAA